MAEKGVERKTFRCAACNWKFRRQEKPKICPYCGKENTIDFDSRQGAEAILKELRDPQGPFRRNS